MTVTRTQPGTSPRSSRTRGAVSSSQSTEQCGFEDIVLPFPSRAGRHGVVSESPTTPGQNANRTVTGSTRKTTGDHHRDLPAGRATSMSSRRPASRTSAAWACRTSASGRASLDRDRDALGEPGHQRQPGASWPSGRTPSATGVAGADLGEHPARGPAEGSPPAAAYDPVERGDRALAGGDRQREQLGHGRELGQDPPLALLDLRA